MQERDQTQGLLDRTRIELDDVRLEAGCQRERAETLEADRARWEAQMDTL